MFKLLDILTRSLGYTNSLTNTVSKPGALLALFFMLYMHENNPGDLAEILETCTEPETQFPLLPAVIKVVQVVVELLVVHQMDVFQQERTNCLRQICKFFTGLMKAWSQLFKDLELSLENSAEATGRLAKQARKRPLAFVREPIRLN